MRRNSKLRNFQSKPFKKDKTREEIIIVKVTMDQKIKMKREKIMMPKIDCILKV